MLEAIECNVGRVKKKKEGEGIEKKSERKG
jgi:hypothetical protein